MKFKKGTKIYSSVGEQVGELKRVVLDPQTNEISHLVIEKGILIKEDKVIPIGLIEDQEGKRIGLKIKAKELEDFPAFTKTEFKSLIDWDDEDLKAYQYASSYHWWSSINYLGFVAPRLVHERLGNIPDDAIALKEGANVMSRNGERLGYLENIISDPKSNEITHIIVSEGGINPKKRLAPIFWVKEITSDEVDLVVKEKYFENLPEYKTE